MRQGSDHEPDEIVAGKNFKRVYKNITRHAWQKLWLTPVHRIESFI